MGSLLSCLAKSGKNIPRDYRDAILARAKELRDGGAGSQAAALQAIDERITMVQAQLPAGDGAQAQQDGRSKPRQAAKGHPQTDVQAAAERQRASRGTAPSGPDLFSGADLPDLIAAYKTAKARERALSDAKNVNLSELARAVDATRDARAPLVAKLAEQPALSAMNGNGLRRIVAGSAQKQGQWQLTRFDQNGEPWGDSQYTSQEAAIDDFLREVDIDTLEMGDVAQAAPPTPEPEAPAGRAASRPEAPAERGAERAAAEEKAEVEPWKLTREQAAKDYPGDEYDRMLNRHSDLGDIPYVEADRRARINAMGQRKLWAKTRAQLEQEGKDAVKAARGDRAATNKLKGTPEFASWRIKAMSRKGKEAIAEAERLARDYLAIHKERVQEALMEGKDVPAEVLADYPDLKRPAAPQPTSGEAAPASTQAPAPDRTPKAQAVKEALAGKVKPLDELAKKLDGAGMSARPIISGGRRVLRVVNNMQGGSALSIVPDGDSFKVVQDNDMGGGLREKIAARLAEVAAPTATHKDPGEPAEPVTPAVVREAIKTGVQDTGRKPSAMRAELLREIDLAIEEAPDYGDYQAMVKTMGEKDAAAVMMQSGEKGAPPGYSRPKRTFKVEGDGIFTIQNSVRQLLLFRDKVEKSPGFKDRQAPAGLNESATDALDRRSTDSAIANMLDEGDFQAALDYAEAKGVDIANVKLSKLLRDRLDKWQKDQESAKRMAEYQAAQEEGKPAPGSLAAAFAEKEAETAPAPSAEPEADDIPEAGIASQTFDQWVRAKYNGNEYRAEYLEEFGGDERRAILGAAVGTIDNDRKTPDLLKAARAKYHGELLGLPRETSISLEVWDALDNMAKVEAQRHFYDLDRRITRRTQDETKARVEAERIKKAPYEAAFAEVDAEIRRLDALPGPETQKQKDLSVRRDRLREALYQIGQGKEPDGRLLRKEAAPAEAPKADAQRFDVPDPPTWDYRLKQRGGSTYMVPPVGQAFTQETRRALRDWATAAGFFSTITGDNEVSIAARSGGPSLDYVVDGVKEQAAGRQAAKERAAEAPKAEQAPAEQAAAILNAAAEPPKGAERLSVIKDVKSGAITPEEVAAAFPPAGEVAAVEPVAEKPAKQPAAKIGDFGEKLEGARKDYATTLKDAEDVDVSAEPLSKSWPEPDYQKLLDGGADPFVVAFIHAARDEVPTKPQKSWKLKGWVDSVQTLRGAARGLLDGSISREQLDSKLTLRAFDNVRLNVGSRAELYQFVGHEKSLKGITFAEHQYSLYKGQSNVRKWVVEQKAKATMFSNWPRELAVADTKAEMLEQFKARFAEPNATGKSAPSKGKFSIYTKRKQEGVFIGKKIGREYIDLKKLPDIASARKFLDENTAELETLLEKYKETPFERNPENQPRVGDDHRNGAPVTPKIFEDTFGFRGVQFGNYVEQARRQSDLNQGFDSLMDLAAVLGVPPRALSLNGRLGLAFGARGKGGTNAPAAHYEPGNVVINLTKNAGPGSLAHEWWHAVDNYFGKNDGGAAYGTGGTLTDKTRAAMRLAFNEVKSATQQGTLRRRAMELDKRKSKPYWDTPIELSARSFESYVIAKLKDQGAANDYLANVVSKEFWDAQEAMRAGFLAEGKPAETYPYPTPDEVPAVRNAFDNFFRVVETRADDAGNVALYEPAPPEYSAPYETDLFGNPVQPPARSTRGAGRERASANGDVDAAGPVPGAPAGQYATKTALVTTRQQKLGATQVRTLADSANALAYLRTSAVERLDGILTDDAGKPLAVIGGFKGALGQTAAYPATLVGEAMFVPGATRLWLVHNHPSGETSLSAADTHLANNIRRVFDGSGVEVMGIVAVGGDRWGGGTKADSFLGTESGGLSPTDGATVPAQERQVTESARLGPQISSPQQAKQVVLDLVRANMGRPSIVLMDSQNRPTAVVPWSGEDAMPLKGNGKLAALYRAVNMANAGAAIIGTGGPLTTTTPGMTLKQAQNLGGALAQLDVRVLDIIDRDGGSVAERGLSTASSVVLSRRAPTPVTLPRVIIGGALSSATSNPLYQAAKAGDRQAALQLARETVTDDLVSKVRAALGSERPFLLPVNSIEDAGRNKIPLMVAEVLGARLGLQTSADVVQANSPKRTAMDGLDRLFNSPEFDGPIQPGAAYLLVDDTLTQGGTFAALASHIEQNGGRVVGSVALTGKGYSATMALSPDLLQQVRERYADVEGSFRAATGYGFDALTESEARYLAKHDSPESVRARIVAAGVAARQRLGAAAAGQAGSLNRNSGRSSGGLTAADLQRTIEALRESGVTGIHAVQSVRQLPGLKRQAVLRSAPDGNVRGAYFKSDDSVYLVADHLNSGEDVAFVLMHEAFHRGLARELGPDAKRLLRQMYLTNAALKQATKQQMLSHRIGLDEAIEEALADMAGAGKAKSLKGWDRLMKMIRDWLGKVGEALGVEIRWTDDMIETFVAGIRNVGLLGRAVHVLPGEPTASDSTGATLTQPGFTITPAMKEKAAGGMPMFARAPATDTKAFRDWFGDSKVVDAQGRPLVVYHGTGRDVEAFSSAAPTATDKGGWGRGFYFAADPGYAAVYARKGAAPNVMPVYVSLRNPIVVAADGEWGARANAIKALGLDVPSGDPRAEWAAEFTEAAQAKGHDGVIQTIGGRPAEVVAFRPEQIKSATGNRGTYNPADPDIRFSRSGATPRTAQDLIDADGTGALGFSRMGRTQQDRMRAVWDGGRRFWLGALTRDQIADIYGDEIASVRDYDRLTRSMENERQSMAQEAEALYERWAKIPAAVNERLARVMLDATVAQVHPDREDPPDGDGGSEAVREHARLRREYLLLTPAAKAMYAEVRDFHAANLDRLRRALEGRLERQIENASERAAVLTDLRLKFDQYLEGGPYFPLHRFGDFLVVAERDQDGERVVAAYENAGEQQAAARELERDGFRVKLRMAKQYSRSMDGSAGKFIGDVLAAIDKADLTSASFNGATTDMKAQLLDDLNQLFIKALPDLSYRKHFAHRKNVPGFSSDVMRGFASSAFHAASHIARLNHGDRMTFALEDAFKQVELAGEGDFTRATQVLGELAQRHDAMLNPSSHPLANMATQAGFVMYLGLSPAAGLINMLQVPMVALPYIGARHGFGKATAALSKAYADIMGAKANRRSGFNAAESPKLSAEERAAMRTLQDEGVIDLTQAHDLAAATDRDVGNQARSKASFAMARAMRIVGWTFHVPEVMNRQVTALMSYRLARASGSSGEDALDQAREAIKRTQFDYSASNRARWMQGDVARVVLQFKQFAQNMTYFLGRAAYQALKGETPEVKRIARRQILSTFAVTGAMAGTMGLPGVGVLGGLIGALADAMGDDDEPWDWKAEYRNALADAFGKEVGEVVAKGLPRALMPWWDISNRVSLADLWWRDAGREGQNPRESFASDMTNILGPTAGTILGWYTAADHMARGQYSKAIEAIVPKFIRDPIKAAREGTEGVTSYIGEPLMQTTLTEDVGRVLGFAPARVSEMYEGRSAVMNAKAALDEKRQNLLSRLVKARLDGDNALSGELWREIGEFNRRNPQFSIKADSVARAIRNKQRNRALTDDGVSVPAGKDYLRERGRFAEVD